LNRIRWAIWTGIGGQFAPDSVVNLLRNTQNAREFEAESITHLVCTRLGLDNRSDKYLSGYLDSDGQVPAISLDLVMKNAWLIEKMAKNKMPLRKKA
jgi:hypothetical protein